MTGDVMIMIGNSVLGTWVETFVREAYRLSENPVEVHLGDGDHIFPDIGRTTGDPRVIVILGPGRKALEMIAQREIRLVAVLDNPVDSVRYTMASKPMSFLESLRLHTRYEVGDYLYFNNPAVLRIERYTTRSARDLLTDLSQRIDVRVRKDEEPSLLSRFGGPVSAPWTIEQALAHCVPHHLPIAQIVNEFSVEQIETVREVLFPLVLAALSDNLAPVTWRTSVFFYGDQPNEVAPPVIDVTGAARTLFYGPYFHLPPGQWEVRVQVAFSAEISGEPFRLILYAQYTPIANVIMMPSEEGLFEATFKLRHTTPEHHLEINFRNDAGLIEGHVALRKMEFFRLAPG